MSDEEFEKELDKMYEEIDQYQAEMEELGLINYGDSGYYWRNPEEYAKDLEICELESKIERLEYLLKVSENALELMGCSYFGNLSCIYFPNTDTQIETNVALVEYFKNLAKEKMKSE